MNFLKLKFFKKISVLFLIIYSILLLCSNFYYLSHNKISGFSFIPMLDLGFDINGGYQITVLLESKDRAEDIDNNIPKLIEIIQKRINSFGVKEIAIEKYGNDRLTFLIPYGVDYESIKKMISTSAKLSFHIVDRNGIVNNQNQKVKDGFSIVPNLDKQKDTYYVINSKEELDGSSIADAFPANDGFNNVISFKLNDVGGKKFGEITRKNVGRMMAIILDGNVLMAPVINTPILGGSGMITGNFKPSEAREIAILLKSGSLPIKLSVIEEKQVSSSLNKNTLSKMIPALILSFSVLLIFLVQRYKIFGAISFFTLFLNMTLTFAFLVICGFNFSLSCIAGFVLMLGMAIDANILIYEKMKEIIKNGVNEKFSIVEHGFKGAMSAILDANITTVIAAIALFIFGNSFMRGFAITLIIGTVCSLFTAVVLTKKIVEYIAFRTNFKLRYYV
ncbi:MAG: preprotein translocase subunit SecD [Pseudomonadota bacterium]|jgi:protein-export membrane protein SecD